MKHVTVTATNTHDEKVSTFSGVPLLDIPAPRWVRMVKTIRVIANP